MRYLCVIIICFLICSCNAKQKVLTVKEVDKSASFCPDDGVCTFEVLQNKSLKVLHDEFGNLYKEISEGTSIILKFEYKRNQISNTVDGHYRELIYVELDPNNLTFKLDNSQLQNVKLLFARFCFCKGQTGYYKVKNGKLFVSKENDNYRINLEFKVNEVPQVITSINEVFRLKK